MRRCLVTGAAGFALLLAACSQPSDDSSTGPSPDVTSVSSGASPEPSQSQSPSPSPSPSPEITPATDLSAVEVTDEDKPVITVDSPWAIEQTTVKVLRESDNPQVVDENSTVTVNYVGVNGRTGEIFDSSYDRGQPVPFPLDSVIPGFQKGLTGQHIGSRVVIGMPSEDGYPQGSPPLIEPGDSLIFVVDLISANFNEATGDPVTPAEGLPVVEMADDGPSVTIPEGDPPSELKVQPLITGPGTKVQATDTIQVKYRAWNWATGEIVEDAWHAQQGPLETLIPGWKEGLVNQTTGSRVLLVVPPEKAYPDGNADNPTLEPGQTLVYVIDLLYSTPAPDQ